MFGNVADSTRTDIDKHCRCFQINILGIYPSSTKRTKSTNDTLFMKALIFGITGQDGHYLRDLLLSEGHTVFGAARSGGDVRMDVSDRDAVRAVVREFQPDYVFHFAATSSTAHEHLWANHSAIATGTLSILDAVERETPDARVLVAGSGLQFVNHGQPLDEDSPIDHSSPSPYVIARNYSLSAVRYYRSRGIKAYFAFLFHHDSPLRDRSHLSMKIVESAVQAKLGARGKLLIGDPDAEKEFAYAGDIVTAMWKLIQQELMFECVVGSGVPYKVSEWLDACFRMEGLDWRDHVEINHSYKNPCRRLLSNPARIKELGWLPNCGFSELAGMMISTLKHQNAA